MTLVRFLLFELLTGAPGLPHGLALLGRNPKRHPEGLLYGWLLGRFATTAFLIGSVALFGPTRTALLAAGAMAIALGSWGARRLRRADSAPPLFPAWKRGSYVGAVVLLALTATLAGGPLVRVGRHTSEGYAYHRYFPGDFLKQVAMTAEIAKGELPPQNPWLAGVPLHYYWASFVPAALYARIGASSAGIEKLLLTETWITDAVFVLALFSALRLFGAADRWAGLATTIALSATGYEGVYLWFRRPAGLVSWLAIARSTNVDALTRQWWGPPQIDGLFRALLYSPPHLQALTFGLLLLALVSHDDVGGRPLAATLAGLAAAASIAASFFVGGVVTAWFGMVAGIAALRAPEQRLSRSIRVGLSLVPAVATVAGCRALGMLGHEPGTGLALGIPTGLRAHPVLVPLLNLGAPLLLGALGAVLTTRSAWRERAPVALLVAIALATLAMVSLEGYTNDVALKAGLVAQVGLAVFGAAALQQFADRRRAWLGIGLAALVAVPAALTTMLDWRYSRAIDDRSQTHYVRDDEMEAARWIRGHLPERAVVQARPLDEVRALSFVPVFGERRSALGDLFFARIYQVPAALVAERQRDVRQLFHPRDLAEMVSILDRYHIDFVVLDPADTDLAAFRAAHADAFAEDFRNASYTVIHLRHELAEGRS